MKDPGVHLAHQRPVQAYRSNKFNINIPDMIRFMFVDYAGMRRCKILPAARIQDNVRFLPSTITMLHDCMATPDSTITSSPAELLAANPADLKPEAKSPSPEPYCNVAFRPIQLPWHPNHYIQLCNLTEPSGAPSPLCPRGALRRAVGLLRNLDLTARVGFELEFLLLHRAPDGTPDRARPFGGGYRVFASHAASDAAAEVLDDMVACLGLLRVPVRLAHREGEAGQFEIVLDHCEALEAVDRLVVARETVRAVAERHGLAATFAPKLGELVGNGAHAHLSLDGHFGTADEWRGRRLGVDAVGRAFMAGVLRALPWLLPFVNGHPLGARRLVPGARAGAYRGWGMHKEVCMRLMEEGTNFEFKYCDGISNPYMQVAAILSAGAMGVAEHLELPEACPSINAHLQPKEKRPALMPTSLHEGLAALGEVRENKLFSEVFPHDLLVKFLSVKRAQAAEFDSMSLQEYEQMTIELH